MELILRVLDAELDIPLDEWTRELLLLQYQRAEAGEEVHAFQSAFAEKVKTMVRFSGAGDLARPTDRQILYAADISAEMNIALPPDVFRYFGAMSEFLARYAPRFNRQVRGEPLVADEKPDDESTTPRK